LGGGRNMLDALTDIFTNAVVLLAFFIPVALIVIGLLSLVLNLISRRRRRSPKLIPKHRGRAA